MNIEDPIASQHDHGEQCVVCGKSVAGGHGYVRVNYRDRLVALCCPLCQETFQRNPADYIRHQETRDEVKAIYDLLHSTG
jgi:YHS domain-containing protein